MIMNFNDDVHSDITVSTVDKFTASSTRGAVPTVYDT